MRGDSGLELLRVLLSEALYKLSLCNALLSALPSSHPPCTFTLLLHTNTPHQLDAQPHSLPPLPSAVSSASPPSTPSCLPPVWLRTELHGVGVAADGGADTAAAPVAAAPPTSSSLAPPSSAWLIEIRSIRTPSLEVEVYIQETQSKQRHTPTQTQQQQRQAA